MKKVISFILTFIVLSSTLIGANFSVNATPVNVILLYRNSIISYATNAINAGYSDDNRFGPYTYDCSGLAYKAYKYAGISIPSDNAAAQAKDMVYSGKMIPYSARTKGDLIFYDWKPNNNDRFLDIDYVAICAGNGYIIDASHTYDVSRRFDTAFSTTSVKVTSVPMY